MARTAAPDPALTRALAGVRALVLDADGVLVLRDAPIPGAAAALATLDRLRIPYRVVTNYSSAHRETLARRFGMGAGLSVAAGRIITAASTAAARTRERHPGRPLYVIASGDALREWEGQRVLSADEADAPGAEVAAVVIGDAGDALTFRELDIAFRHIRAGAEFVAMHRNPWWLTRRGVTLDAGALIAGLEYATGRRAIVTGKPSPVVFREAVAELRAELHAGPAMGGDAASPREPRLVRSAVAMVGDDPRSDIAGAHRAGLRAILVLTGKTGPGDLPAILASADPDAPGTPGRRGGRRPDGVAASLEEVVAALASR